MTFDWLEYFQIAEKFLTQAEYEHNSQAYYRSSISRAYYSVFCILRNTKKLNDSKKGNIHKYLIDLLKKSHNEDEIYIGTILDELRYLRNLADYDDKENIDKKRAKGSIEKAKQILEILKSL